MSGKSKGRDTIVHAAATLFRRRGYAATGLNDIIAESGAPKGSLYHYFPGGKAQIGAAAVALAGHVVADTLAALAERSDTPAALVRLYASRLIGWMEQSGFQDGCPMATILLEAAPADADISAAGRTAFLAWCSVLAGKLRSSGVSADLADRLGSFAISTLEGALIQARVTRNGVPIEIAADQLALVFDSAVRAAA